MTQPSRRAVKRQEVLLEGTPLVPFLDPGRVKLYATVPSHALGQVEGAISPPLLFIELKGAPNRLRYTRAREMAAVLGFTHSAN